LLHGVTWPLPASRRAEDYGLHEWPYNRMIPVRRTSLPTL